MTLVTDFDQPHYAKINKARADWLNLVLDHLPETKTALDVGCGAGYFSNLLQKRGLDVTGVDLQKINLDTCKALYPKCEFEQVDLDREFSLPKKDLVLVFGLIYHLKSPFFTISNLMPSIGEMAVVSTVVNLDAGMTFKPYYESNGPTQNHTSDVSLVPSESAVKEMFAHHGFTVYQPGLVKHEQWTPGVGFPNAKRVSFVASLKKLNVNWPAYQKIGFYKKWN